MSTSINDHQNKLPLIARFSSRAASSQLPQSDQHSYVSSAEKSPNISLRVH